MPVEANCYNTLLSLGAQQCKPSVLSFAFCICRFDFVHVTQIKTLFRELTAEVLFERHGSRILVETCEVFLKDFLEFRATKLTTANRCTFNDLRMIFESLIRKSIYLHGERVDIDDLDREKASEYMRFFDQTLRVVSRLTDIPDEAAGQLSRHLDEENLKSFTKFEASWTSHFTTRKKKEAEQEKVQHAT
eukprot:Opistho-2@11156